MRACSPSPPARRAATRVFCALLTAACCAGAANLVHADIQEPITAHTAGQRLQRRGQSRDTTPANGLARQVQIHQGDTVEIVLTARGQLGRTVEFVIQTPPAHGTMDGPPRQLTRNTASVTYTQHAGDGAAADSFTYTVQAGGSAVSAAVPVSIEILEPPPSLVATPDELDFGTVKAGESTRATLTLENRGGGIATGRVEPPPPWTVEGDAQYRIARGESQSFQLVFQPSYGRSYVETQHFRGDEGPGVRLVGTGIGPHDPAEDADRPGAAGSVAESIARANALALAEENAALPRAPTGGGAPPMTARALAPETPEKEAAAHPAPTAASARDITETPADGTLNLPPGGADSVVVNEAAVTRVSVRAVGTTTFDLSWTPPRPTPKSYRVELRYLTLDAADNLRVDWRPYAKAEIRPTASQVTAQVGGLPAGARQNVRIVAVDDAGRLAAPSPVLVITTGYASTWWHLTPLKVLVFMLLVCVGLLIYRRWEEQQIVRSIDESRASRHAEVMQHRS